MLAYSFDNMLGGKASCSWFLDLHCFIIDAPQATGVYPLWLVPAILDETGEDDPMFVDLGVYGWCHRFKPMQIEK